MRFDVLHPADASGQDNHASCVLRIWAGGQVVLLTGDAEVADEQAMRERWGDDTLAADVLVAGHHGSLTSSGQDFLAAVRPVQVVVSAGYRNRFRHPHPTVWARYADWGAQRWRTDRDGAVQIALGHPAGPQLSGYRAGHPHWWRSRWP